MHLAWVPYLWLNKVFHPWTLKEYFFVPPWVFFGVDFQIYKYGTQRQKNRLKIIWTVFCKIPYKHKIMFFESIKKQMMHGRDPKTRKH